MKMLGATAVVASAVSALAVLIPGVAQPHTARAASSPECVVHSLPSFVESASSSSVADIVEVGCELAHAGQTVELSAKELYGKCLHRLKWSSPYPYAPVSGSSFKVKLDEFGNATAALWGGPSCAAGESLVSAHLESAPFTTFATSFTVQAPRETPQGVYATPSTQVEDSTHSSTATIVQVEVSPLIASGDVTITAPALPRRCTAAPHVTWVGPDAKALAKEKESVSKLKLDQVGNAFVVILSGPSCASGPSLIVATTEEAPYESFTTDFTIEVPRVVG
jgi:hypothetical protein